MKNIKYIIQSCMTVLFIASMSSCEIEEYNPSGVTADAIWSTPEGFQTLVNIAYSDQRTWYGKTDGLFMSETGTDLWFNKEKDGWAKEISKYEDFTPSTGNPNKATWREMNKALNLCNAGIGRIGDVDFPSEEVRNQKEGELRFLRAFYLWHIVETWGGVSLRTEETKEPVLTAVRSQVEDFYEVIMGDLEFAKDNLPLDYGDEYSRATVKSALGLLARVYLTKAYQLTGDQALSYYTMARDMAKEVIDRQEEFNVSLWNNYADLWNPNNNKENKEALYVVSNSTNTAINYDLNANRLHLWFITGYSGKPGMQLSMEYGVDDRRRLMPTLHVLDLFDENMDSRYENSFQEVWLCNDSADIPVWTAEEIAAGGLDPGLIDQNKFEYGDTAMYITRKSISDENTLGYLVIDRDSVYDTAGNGAIHTGDDYVQLTKYLDPVTRTDATSRPGYQDVIVIRLAEMYLIAAEAEFKLNNRAQAATYINVLRTRAAKKTPIDYTQDMQVTAGDISVEFILDERGRELCGEHIRWFDIKRVFSNDPAGFVSYIKTRNPDIVELKEHHILRPVPQTEIDALLNGEEFGQNPGY
ncbi:MAG: RagB/SusD family nutrient uptake outer membrane protein [Bacteroidales bacterium]|nr:MAG: RagB/SusD family nutrient uptake outer membrane protein [Bacteroidales bacterium]